jgi:hypothetical protein
MVTGISTLGAGRLRSGAPLGRIKPSSTAKTAVIEVSIFTPVKGRIPFYVDSQS